MLAPPECLQNSCRSLRHNALHNLQIVSDVLIRICSDNAFRLIPNKCVHISLKTKMLVVELKKSMSRITGNRLSIHAARTIGILTLFIITLKLSLSNSGVSSRKERGKRHLERLLLKKCISLKQCLKRPKISMTAKEYYIIKFI